MNMIQHGLDWFDLVPRHTIELDARRFLGPFFRSTRLAKPLLRQVECLAEPMHRQAGREAQKAYVVFLWKATQDLCNLLNILANHVNQEKTNT